jgi:hypothetical protein
VAQGGFSDQALKEEDLVSKLDRVAVAQVDFKLTGTAFLSDTVDFQSLGFGKVLDVINDRAIFVHG